MTAPVRFVNADRRSGPREPRSTFAATATCEDGSDAVRQRCDQARRVPVLVPCAADGLPSIATTDRPHHLGAPGPQPSTEDVVEFTRVDRSERPAEPDSSAAPRAAPSVAWASASAQASAAHCSIANRPTGECRRPRSLREIGDLGKQIEQVLATGSRNGRRCHGGLRSSYVDGKCENFHRAARGPPAAHRHPGPPTGPADPEGHELHCLKPEPPSNHLAAKQLNEQEPSLQHRATSPT